MSKVKSNGSKSTALAKSEPAELVTGADGIELPGVGVASEADAAELLREMMAGAMAPKIISLDQVGAYVTGELLGEGSGVEFQDPSGEERVLPTFNFRLDNGIVVGLIASHQLVKELPAMKGKRVRVLKMGQFTSKKGRRVNDFAISVLA